MSTKTTTEDGEKRIPESIISELRIAGASQLFLDVIQISAEEVPGADRNSARQEVLKYMNWAEDSEKEVTDYLHYGGGFFQSLLKGETGGADSNNQAILEYRRGGSSNGDLVENLL